MSDADRTEIREDSRFHDYRGNAIPWYVRLMWIGFWVFAVAYAIQFLFPSLREELFLR